VRSGQMSHGSNWHSRRSLLQLEVQDNNMRVSCNLLSIACVNAFLANKHAHWDDAGDFLHFSKTIDTRLSAKSKWMKVRPEARGPRRHGPQVVKKPKLSGAKTSQIQCCFCGWKPCAVQSDPALSGRASTRLTVESGLPRPALLKSLRVTMVVTVRLTVFTGSKCCTIFKLA